MNKAGVTRIYCHKDILSSLLSSTFLSPVFVGQCGNAERLEKHSLLSERLFFFHTVWTELYS